MKTILLAAGAAVLAAATPALAQDAAPTSGPALSHDFSGPRAEIFGGWDQLRRHERNAGDQNNRKDDGVTGGALLGYDVPLGDRFIVGPFASIAYTSTKECAQGVGCLKTGRQLEGGARFGMKLGQRALVYGKGAYVNGAFSTHVLNDGGTQYVVGDTRRDGWRAGAGLEYALSPHAYVKAEYDYTRFKTFDASELVGTNATRIRFDRNEALGGFGVRF